jgi:hypothetical protein
MKLHQLDAKLAEIRIDNEHGAGATPLNREVDYFGLRVLMRPSVFLKLALPMLDRDDYVSRHIQNDGAIAAPFLQIDIPKSWDPESGEVNLTEPARVVGHEGRHRMTAVKRMEGDAPIEVHLFPRGYRRRHITAQWLEALNRALRSERDHAGVVRGPLFTMAAQPQLVEMATKRCGDCFQAAARNMLHGSDDEMILVHAYVSGQGPLKGRRFLHAWNEQGNLVIDNSNGRDIRLPREIYYAIGNIDPNDDQQFRRYTRQDAVRSMARTRHYGPWDLKESVRRVMPVVPVTKQYPTQQRPKDPPVPKDHKPADKKDTTGRVRLTAEDQSKDSDLPSVTVAQAHLPEILAAAQRVYDAWDESDRDTYAGGGICHIIADSVCEVLGSAGVESVPVSCSYEQHVYVAALFEEGVYTIDIPYRVYEEGGGFSWSKLPGVRFQPRDVVFYRASADPQDWQHYINENFADGKVKGKSRPGRVRRAGASCKGSVTDLRAKAKKYGGERGKMYHWCANMKSGRQ